MTWVTNHKRDGECLHEDIERKKELQKDWNELGPNGFEMKVLEQIEYDDGDESRTDYEDNLDLLKMMWVERLTRDNIELY